MYVFNPRLRERHNVHPAFLQQVFSQAFCDYRHRSPALLFANLRPSILTEHMILGTLFSTVICPITSPLSRTRPANLQGSSPHLSPLLPSDAYNILVKSSNEKNYNRGISESILFEYLESCQKYQAMHLQQENYTYRQYEPFIYTNDDDCEPKCKIVPSTTGRLC
eukprot:c39773_g1_i1 orf=2-493(-)